MGPTSASLGARLQSLTPTEKLSAVITGVVPGVTDNWGRCSRGHRSQGGCGWGGEPAGLRGSMWVVGEGSVPGCGAAPAGTPCVLRSLCCEDWILASTSPSKSESERQEHRKLL